jgi:tetraacyldisaccharide 4'-kinase
MYKMVLKLRHTLYDKQILKSSSFNFPLICVGNLAMGGTGKSPMTEYLIRLLKDHYHTATLSRGYKRKTKGFAIAGVNTSAIDIGDEPMQFHRKFPEVTVAVGEERLIAIPQLLHDRPETEVIILDDAFQHRAVQAGLNILLTSYNNIYTDDELFPAGTLRDVASAAERAQIIIVTKCPETLTESEREVIQRRLHPKKNQRVFFTTLEYDAPFHLYNNTNYDIKGTEDIVLITGVAQPAPLINYVKKVFHKVELMQYPDHHIFNMDDLKQIRETFDKMRISNQDAIIVTTEKDGVRLEKFASELNGYPVYCLPVRHKFLFGQQLQFDKQVFEFIDGYK